MNKKPDEIKAMEDAPFAVEFREVVQDMVTKTMEKEINKKIEARIPGVIIPDSVKRLNMTDKDKNEIHRIVVFKEQLDDAIKAIRKAGYTAREFNYNQVKFNEDEQERSSLKATLENSRTAMHQTAQNAHEELFIALMHFKVIRTYIDAVLRFGIPPKFWLGIVMPRKGAEKSIQWDMMNVLAEEGLKEMYGEKNANEQNDADDFWPFVSVPLTTPEHIHRM